MKNGTSNALEHTYITTNCDFHQTVIGWYVRVTSSNSNHVLYSITHNKAYSHAEVMQLLLNISRLLVRPQQRDYPMLILQVMVRNGSKSAN